MKMQTLSSCLTLFCWALLSVGCSAGTNNGNSQAVNQGPQPTPALVVVPSNPATVTNNQTAAPVNPNAPAPPVTQTAATPAPPVIIPPPVQASATPRRGPPPTPEISSGGNDLFLFRNVRAALDNSTEVPGAAIIVNIKDGVVVLTGTVDTDAQKARAEQLVRQVSGVKSVRNEVKSKK